MKAWENFDSIIYFYNSTTCVYMWPVMLMMIQFRFGCSSADNSSDPEGISKMGDRHSMQLYHALHRGNHPRVRHQVLNEGTNVNHMFADGTFPVHIAAEAGDLLNLNFLLSLRASPDMKNRHGQTALMLGIMHPEIVGTLVEHGCRVNLTDSQRRSALHLSCARGVVQVVSRLLLAGARVNCQDRWSRTPLHIALLNISHQQAEMRKFVQVVQLLLKHKAGVNDHDKHRNTPLFLAVNCNNVEITEMMIQRGANLDTYSRHHLTPLMLASMKGYVDIAQLLISHNCKVNARNPETDKTSFAMAVGRGHFDIAQLLVEAGCKFYREQWLLQRQMPKNVDAEMEEWLLTLCGTVPSLKAMCRNIIRKMLGKKILVYINMLQYPIVLKKYILLQDVTNIWYRYMKGCIHHEKLVCFASWFWYWMFMCLYCIDCCGECWFMQVWSQVTELFLCQSWYCMSCDGCFFDIFLTNSVSVID